MSRRRTAPAPWARELRLLVAPALGSWTKVMQIVVILLTVILGTALVLTAVGSLIGPLPLPNRWIR